MIRQDEVTVVKETEDYKLIEGTGGSAGCFALRRNSDGSQLDWYCGSQAKEWADRLKAAYPKKFNQMCEAEFDI